jgi:hypothetical protein
MYNIARTGLMLVAATGVALVGATAAMAGKSRHMHGVGYGENIGIAKDQARGAIQNRAEAWGVGLYSGVTVSISDVDCTKAGDLYRCKATGTVKRKPYD